MKKLCRLLLVIGCILCLTGTLAAAETARGDLSDRFGEPTVEYQDVTYRVKNRLSTMVFLFVDETAEPEEQILLMGIVAVDDDQKRLVPFYVDSRTEIIGEDGQPRRLFEIYTSVEDDEQKCLQLVQAINALFPLEVLESYMAVKIEGLDLLDGGAPATEAGTDRQAALKQRLKRIKAEAEGASSNDVMSQFSAMSEYLVTDMKTGEVAKIADKATRYEISPSCLLPGELLEAEQGMVYRINEEELLPLVIDAFYEEKIW